MVIVYRRIRDDISSLFPMRASVINGAEPRRLDSATVRGLCARLAIGHHVSLRLLADDLGHSVA